MEPKRKRQALTGTQKHRIAKYRADHPFSTDRQVAEWFAKPEAEGGGGGRVINRSVVGKVCRSTSPVWAEVDPSTLESHIGDDWPELDAALQQWVQR